MRILTVLLNIALLVIALILTIDEFGYMDANDVLAFGLLNGAPLMTLIVIFRSGLDPSSPGWIRSYLERKRREEECRIGDLARDSGSRKRGH